MLNSTINNISMSPCSCVRDFKLKLLLKGILQILKKYFSIKVDFYRIKKGIHIVNLK